MRKPVIPIIDTWDRGKSAIRQAPITPESPKPAIKRVKLIEDDPKAAAYHKAVRALGSHPGRVTRALALVQDNGGCRWPIGALEDPSFYFCGDRQVNGPYCPFHKKKSVS